jgi:hypothetical protein
MIHQDRCPVLGEKTALVKGKMLETFMLVSYPQKCIYEEADCSVAGQQCFWTRARDEYWEGYMMNTGKSNMKIATLQIGSVKIPAVPLWLSLVGCLLPGACPKLGRTSRFFATEQNTLIKRCIAHTTSNTTLLTLQDAHKSELVSHQFWSETGASWLQQRGLNDSPCAMMLLYRYYTYTGIISA